MLQHTNLTRILECITYYMDVHSAYGALLCYLILSLKYFSRTKILPGAVARIILIGRERI